VVARTGLALRRQPSALSGRAYYIVTNPIEGAFDELPLGRDPDLCIYFRGEAQASCWCVSKIHQALVVDKIPDDLFLQVARTDWEKYQEPLAAGRLRIPALETCGFEKFVNGDREFHTR
jgi:hypothetical protein